MSDPCLSGLVVDFSWGDVKINRGSETDFHDEDDETPMVTLRLEMEHPSGDEDLTVFAQVQVAEDEAFEMLNDDEVPESLMNDIWEAINSCGGFKTWLNDPERAQMIWRAHEQPGGTA